MDIGRRLASMPEEHREFALLNLAHHLHQSRQHDALYRLIDRPWQDAQLAYLGSYGPFSKDVALAIDLAATRFPSDLVDLWRCVLIAVRIGAAATQVPSETIRLAAQLGRYEQATGWAALVRDGAQRCRSYVAIASVLHERGLTDLAVAAAVQAEAAAHAEQPVVSRARSLASVAGLGASLGRDDVVTRSIAALLEGPRGHWIPDVLAALVPQLVTARRSNDMGELVAMTRGFSEDVNDSSINADTAHRIATGFAALGMRRELRDLFERIEALPAGDRRMLMLAAIVTSIADLEDREGVDGVGRLVSPTRPPRLGVDDVGTAGPRVDTASIAEGRLCEELSVAYARLGDEPSANAWLERAVNGRDHGDRLPIDRARMLARIGRYEEAMVAAELVAKPHVRSNALRLVARTALARDDKGAAAAAAARAMTAARLVDPEDLELGDLQGPVEAVVDTAELLWDLGERESAGRTAVEMLGFPAFLCDPTYGPGALKTIIRILGEAGDIASIERAVVVGETIEDGTFREEAMLAAMQAMAGAGAVDRALELGRQSEFAGGGAGIIASRLFAAGDAARATEVLDRALAEATDVEVANYAAAPYRAVAEALLKLGRRDEAKEAAAQALAAAQRMEATSTGEHVYANGIKARALAQIASTLARLGDVASAKTIARSAVEEANPQQPRVRSSIKGEAWRSGVAIWGQLEAVQAEVAPILALASDADTVMHDAAPSEQPPSLSETAELETALGRWRDACLAAATLDLGNTYTFLETSAPLLARLDGGKTLWRTFQATVAVSNWARHANRT